MENHGTQIGIRINSSIGFPSIVSRDPDAVDYISRVKLTGALFGTTLTQERLTEKAVDEYVKISKEATNSFGKTNWLAMKALNLMSGITTIEGILVPMRPEMAPVTNFNFVQGDLDRTGLKGGGSASGKYLGSGRNNNADPQGNQSLAVYASEPQDGNSTFALIGSGTTSDTGISQIAGTNGNLYFRSQTSASDGHGTISPGGFFGMSRAGGSAYKARSGGVTADFSRAAQTPANLEIFIFARGTTGSANTNTNARLSYFSIGEDLDLEAADLAISTYMAAIL